MTWQGTIYLERCVEHPDYRIKTSYSPEGQYCIVYHKQKIIGRAGKIEDARAKAQAHLESQ